MGLLLSRKTWNQGKVKELENGQGKSGLVMKIREKSGNLCDPGKLFKY